MHASNTPLKEYLPSQRHVSSSRGAFVNYTGGAPTPEAVWADFPDAVIVDGSDDWTAPDYRSVWKLQREFDTPILARFHTGISGITRSGIVVSPDVFDDFRRRYAVRFPGFELTTHLRVYVPTGGAPPTRSRAGATRRRQ